MLELLKAFSIYIQIQTGMPVMQTLPEVQLVPVCQMTTMFEGEDAVCNLTSTHVAGIYIRNNNLIVVADDIDISTARDASIILHETVHAQQAHDPRLLDASCITLEYQAYDVQIRWLKDVAHVDPTKTIGINDPNIGAILSCANKPSGIGSN